MGLRVLQGGVRDSPHTLVIFAWMCPFGRSLRSPCHAPKVIAVLLKMIVASCVLNSVQAAAVTAPAQCATPIDFALVLDNALNVLPAP